MAQTRGCCCAVTLMLQGAVIEALIKTWALVLGKASALPAAEAISNRPAAGNRHLPITCSNEDALGSFNGSNTDKAVGYGLSCVVPFSRRMIGIPCGHANSPAGDMRGLQQATQCLCWLHSLCCSVAGAHVLLA